MGYRSAGPRPDVTEAHLETVRRMFSAEHAHDGEALAALAADSVEFDDYTARIRARGPAEFRRTFERSFREIPDLAVEFLFGFANERYFFAECQVTGHRVVDAYGGRGPLSRIRRWSIGEITLGPRILRRRDYWDSALQRH
jgi:hypothetical protein